MLSAIAARTQRIRLGTSIFLLPLSHPLDVAEQVASLDSLSGGRVIFGPGLGYRPYEFEALGLPFHRRGRLMAECLEIVQGAWEHESFSYEGEFYSFTDVTVSPRPVQQHIPVWVGANSDAAMQRAARLADGWIVGFSDRLPKLVPRLADYRSLAAEAGRSSTVCLMRLVGLGATREEVESTFIPTVYQMLRGYARVRHRPNAATRPSSRSRPPTAARCRWPRWATTCSSPALPTTASPASAGPSTRPAASTC